MEIDAGQSEPVVLNRLGALAGEASSAIKRRRLLENLDALTQACLQRDRHYVNKDGDERSYPDPDLKTALQAQLAGARILGEANATVTQEQFDDVVRKARRAISKRLEKQEHIADELTERANGKAETH